MFPQITGIYLAFYYQPDQLSSVARFLPVFFVLQIAPAYSVVINNHSTEHMPISNIICHDQFYDTGITDILFNLSRVITHPCRL
jgi:hypothetical protein